MLFRSLRTVNRMGFLQRMKLHQAARSAWGLGRSPILKLKEALKDTLRLMLLDRFQQLLKINQRFLKIGISKGIRRKDGDALPPATTGKTGGTARSGPAPPPAPAAARRCRRAWRSRSACENSSSSIIDSDDKLVIL